MAETKTTVPKGTITNSADRPNMTKPALKPTPKK